MCDCGAKMDLDADAAQIAHRAFAQRLGKRAEHRGRRVEQHDPRLGRIDTPEVAAKRMARQLHELPRELDARRACADDDERQESAPCNRVGLAFGHFESAQDSSAQLECVIDGLHAGRIARELGMTEVRLARAGRDDQAVVSDLAALIQRLNRDAPSARGRCRRLRRTRPAHCAGHAALHATAGRCLPRRGFPSRAGRAAAGTGGDWSGR